MHMSTLFLISPTYVWHTALLQFRLQVLVHCECNSLAGRYTHNTRRDAFIESMESFLSNRELELASGLI